MMQPTVQVKAPVMQGQAPMMQTAMVVKSPVMQG